MVGRVFLTALLFALLVPAAASAKEIDCLTCHENLKQEKVVHPALEMGCTSCHTGIDASTIPHKVTNKIARGLSADQPDLCYGCHDKGPFTKKHVHPALDMGCTSCHNPHSSPNPNLLLATVPELCFTCHDKTKFTKKVVHPPVAAGMCLTCHSPHSSDQMALLVKPPYDLCIDCHPDIANKPHAVSGFSTGGHPLGTPKKGKNGGVKVRKDPARPDRPFYCGSCHNPHSTGAGRLFRFNTKSSMGLCIHCHKM